MQEIYTPDQIEVALAVLQVKGGNIKAAAKLCNVSPIRLMEWAGNAGAEIPEVPEDLEGEPATEAEEAEEAGEADASDLAALKPRHQAFVGHYLQTLNASEAARRAGYTGKPNVIGPRLLANVSIRAVIDARLRAQVMGPDEILARLSAVASTDFADYFTISEDGRPRFNLKRAEREGKLHCIKKLGYTKDGDPVLEFYDAQAARIQLGRYHRLFDSRVADLDAEIERILEEMDRRAKGSPEEAPEAASGSDAGGGAG